MNKDVVFVTSAAIPVQIKIYEYKNQVLVGSIINNFYGEVSYFRDVIEMAGIMERFYDALSFPQASQLYRTFRPTARNRKKYTAQLNAGGRIMNMMPPELENTKEKASFVVHVQFRQHATWQGNITWVDKGVTQQFRSVLEMIRLMTEAVESGDPEHTGFALPMEVEKN